MDNCLHTLPFIYNIYLQKMTRILSILIPLLLLSIQGGDAATATSSPNITVRRHRAFKNKYRSSGISHNKKPKDEVNKGSSGEQTESDTDGFHREQREKRGALNIMKSKAEKTKTKNDPQLKKKFNKLFRKPKTNARGRRRVATPNYLVLP